MSIEHAPNHEEEKQPKISVEFFFAPHGSAKDFELLPQLFKDADVYVPERPGWSADIVKDENRLSQGLRSPRYQKKPKMAWQLQEQMQWASDKLILLADVPADSELGKEMQEFGQLYIEPMNLFESGDYGKAIASLKNRLRTFITQENKRDKIIADQLTTKINNLLQEHPEFKEKTNIKILVSLGSTHTPVFHKLKKEGMPISMKLGRPTLIFDTQSELLRRVQHGEKFENFGENEFAKIFLERFFKIYFQPKFTDDGNIATWAAKKLATKLAVADAKILSTELGNLKILHGNLDDIDKFKKFIPPLLEKLCQKNDVQLPKNFKEFNKFMGIKETDN